MRYLRRTDSETSGPSTPRPRPCQVGEQEAATASASVGWSHHVAGDAQMCSSSDTCEPTQLCLESISATCDDTAADDPIVDDPILDFSQFPSFPTPDVGTAVAAAEAGRPAATSDGLRQKLAKAAFDHFDQPKPLKARRARGPASPMCGSCRYRPGHSTRPRAADVDGRPAHIVVAGPNQRRRRLAVRKSSSTGSRSPVLPGCLAPAPPSEAGGNQTPRSGCRQSAPSRSRSRSRSRSSSPFPGPTQMWGGLLESGAPQRACTAADDINPPEERRSISPTLSFRQEL